jgi:sugar/nucleoside kinase (ribokinase family)
LPPPDLVVLGNLLVDDVVFPDGRTRMGEPGGATVYAALAARLWDVTVGVVTLRGDDYPAAVLDALARRGVDLGGIRALEGPGLRTWLLYEGRRRRVVHHLEGPTHAAASPTAAHLPTGWDGARAFHVAPMPFAAQRELTAALAGRAGSIFALDPFLLLTPETLGNWAEVAAAADVFLMSEDDVEPAADLRRRLSGGRLRYLAEKRGSRGGVLYDRHLGKETAWAPRATHVVDPTGAGDAFGAGFVCGLLLGDDAERALARAVVSASFALEDWGLGGLLAATPDSARRRLRDWFR